jgi:hypothetical protein
MGCPHHPSPSRLSEKLRQVRLGLDYRSNKCFSGCTAGNHRFSLAISLNSSRVNESRRCPCFCDMPGSQVFV